MGWLADAREAGGQPRDEEQRQQRVVDRSAGEIVAQVQVAADKKSADHPAQISCQPFAGSSRQRRAGRGKDRDIAGAGRQQVRLLGKGPQQRCSDQGCTACQPTAAWQPWGEAVRARRTQQLDQDEPTNHQRQQAGSDVGVLRSAKPEARPHEIGATVLLPGSGQKIERQRAQQRQQDHPKPQPAEADMPVQDAERCGGQQGALPLSCQLRAP